VEESDSRRIVLLKPKADRTSNGSLSSGRKSGGKGRNRRPSRRKVGSIASGDRSIARWIFDGLWPSSAGGRGAQRWTGDDQRSERENEEEDRRGRNEHETFLVILVASSDGRRPSREESTPNRLCLRLAREQTKMARISTNDTFAGSSVIVVLLRL